MQEVLYFYCTIIFFIALLECNKSPLTTGPPAVLAVLVSPCAPKPFTAR
ncbi:hypothetical protein Y11_18131 [Yersinia enterocolitica subsp. palearctica Y11]|uniref:Uncharacterized protein n=1 Tax=Yersinia enterocolitica subsp. palearctica serotype O:3 (strain DSM 13030 / CIP 106945 / Y11) TaxID=930944 RepID=A0A0H3NMR4_YERE1|nr:hypothetical protein FORC065_1356 [Yersinia enterocolitica]CBY26368.1 hypothetical protein Y11_18131 [Yersinia enterocolitica subsp. palearctica Y11]CCO69416.1 hypothetical protein D322_2542 [Yersinia enterocolitica IP 10393]